MESPRLARSHVPGRMCALWIAVFAASGQVQAAELTQQTLRAFDRYVQLTETRIRSDVEGRSPFLWVDRQSAAARDRLTARLKRGDILIEALTTRDAGRSIDVPSAMVHHWVGTVLIPGASVADTVALVRNYDRYPTVYAPAVQRARVVSTTGTRFDVEMRLFTKKVISVVLDTRYDVTYEAVGNGRTFVGSRATKIQEVSDPGTPSESRKPVGRDNGFLWRFNNYCSFEARDGGTIMQCETVSLSRDVPTGLGWVVGPFVTSVPRESLTFTLTAARKALTRS